MSVRDNVLTGVDELTALEASAPIVFIVAAARQHHPT
jgi:hypothetical protein